MGGSDSLEGFAVSRERKLDEIARRKAHKEIATGAINIGADPRSGITFEADHRHVGGRPFVRSNSGIVEAPERQ